MSAQFSLVTAFSNAVDGGNPAAVVFIDMTTPVDTFKQIATNFNEPITCFVSATPLPSNAQKTVAFNVRWFTVNKSETPLCGHGTLAAAKAVFDKDDVPKDTELIEFHTLTRGVMKARRLLGGFIEIELPSGKTVDVSAEEHARNSRLVNRAIGKEVAIDRILAGVDAFESYLLFVLDEKENLENLSINATPLTGRHINIFTTQLSDGNERFASRMFAPGYIPGDEDHVCGSAHCLMAPYWYDRLGIPSGKEIRARQVSARGGLLKLLWDAEKNTLKLSGEVAVFGKGELRVA